MRDTSRTYLLDPALLEDLSDLQVRAHRDSLAQRAYQQDDKQAGQLLYKILGSRLYYRGFSSAEERGRLCFLFHERK